MTRPSRLSCRLSCRRSSVSHSRRLSKANLRQYRSCTISPGCFHAVVSRFPPHRRTALLPSSRGTKVWCVDAVEVVGRPRHEVQSGRRSVNGTHGPYNHYRHLPQTRVDRLTCPEHSLRISRQRLHAPFWSPKGRRACYLFHHPQTQRCQSGPWWTPLDDNDDADDDAY